MPSGASMGTYEALEIRDGDKAVYEGKRVLTAVRNINEILGSKLFRLDVRNQAVVDAIILEIDGAPNKSNLGANAILGVSLSMFRAGAGAKGIPLYKHIQEISRTKELVMPLLAFNVINGGSHTGNNLAMQEFTILLIGANSFVEALRMGSKGFFLLFWFSFIFLLSANSTTPVLRKNMWCLLTLISLRSISWFLILVNLEEADWSFTIIDYLFIVQLLQ